MILVFDKLFGYCLGRDNFVHFYGKIKYGNLKKNMVIYHKEGKRVTLGLF